LSVAIVGALKSGAPVHVDRALCTTAEIPVGPAANASAATSSNGSEASQLADGVAHSFSSGGILHMDQRIRRGQRPFERCIEHVADGFAQAQALATIGSVQLVVDLGGDGAHLGHAVVVEVLIFIEVNVQRVEVSPRGAARAGFVRAFPGQHHQVVERAVQPALALDHAFQHHRIAAGVEETPQPAAMLAPPPRGRCRRQRWIRDEAQSRETSQRSWRGSNSLRKSPLPTARPRCTPA
jgi:hypothetical protein